MAERVYYVFCEDGCKFESMTKEQIVTAIMQAVSTGQIQNIDDAFITKVKESGTGGVLKFWKGTEAEFNMLGVSAARVFVRLSADGQVYLCTDDSFLDDFLQLACIKSAEAAEQATLKIVQNKQDLHRSTSICIYSTDWAMNGSGFFEYTVSDADSRVISGKAPLSEVVTESNTVFVAPASDMLKDWTSIPWERFGVRCVAQGAGSLTFWADEKPDSNIFIHIASFAETASRAAIVEYDGAVLIEDVE